MKNFKAFTYINNLN